MLLTTVACLSVASTAVAGEAPVNLRSAGNFAILAGSTITSANGGTLYGDIGVWPGSAITGFPPSVVVGNTFAGTVPAQLAQADLLLAYNDAAGRSTAPILKAGNLGGQTLFPGLYKSNSSLEISSGDLTLDAQGDSNAVFIFQMASTLTTGPGRKMILVGGAQPANIFWQVGSSATFGTTSVIKGNVLANISITCNTGSTLEGKALAINGAVVFDGAAGIANPRNFPAPELIITEIVNGPFADFKYVEIRNAATTATIDLGFPQITLRRYRDGATTPTAISLAGTIAPGGFFVIANNQADLDDVYGPGVIMASQLDSNIDHNGDDSYDLFDGDVLDGFSTDWVTGIDPGNPAADGSFYRVKPALPNNGDWGSTAPVSNGFFCPSGFWVRRQISAGNDNGTSVTTPFSDDDTTVGSGIAELSIVKTADVPLVVVGNPVEFTLTVFNAGSDTATSVTVTDAIPAGFSYQASSSSQGSTTESAGVVTADLGSIATGSTATVTIFVTGTAVGTYDNVGVVSAPQIDNNAADNSSTATVQVVPIPPALANLTVTKTASATTAGLGDTVTYTVTVSNAGPGASALTSLADALPPQVTFTSATLTQGSFIQNSGVIAADLGTLNAGASATLVVDVVAASTGTAVNTATAAGSLGDPDPTDNSSSATVLVVQRVADLSVVKTADSGTVSVGSPVVFTLAVANAGPDTQTNVSVTDAIPSGFTYQSATASQGSVTQSGGTVTAALGSLASGSTATVTINVLAAIPGTYNNVGVATGTLVDNSPADNVSTATVTVDPLADLQVSKSASPASIFVGGSTVFTIDISNSGPSTATAVQLSDIVPAGLTVTGASFPAGSVTVSGNSVTADLATLASGSSATLTVTATGDTTGVFNNTADVTGAESDPDLANNSASATVTVTVLPAAFADLSIVKTADVPVVTLSNPVEFTLAVSNAGPDTATSVTVTDAIPAGFSYQASSSSQGSTVESFGVVTADLGSIAAGSTATVTIFVRGTAVGTYDNVGVVSAPQIDNNAADNSSTATVQVIPLPPATANLTVTKVASETTVGLGGDIFYAVTVSNSGPGSSAVTSLADVLPAEVTFTTAALTQGTFIETSGVISANLGMINPGSSVTLIVKVIANSTGTAVNTASAAGSLGDPDPADNSSSATVLIVQPVSDLAIVKTVDNATPAAGSPFNYTLLVTNNGPETNYGVTAFDSVPAGIDILSVNSPAGTTVTVAGQDVSVDLGLLDIGATATVSIQAQGSSAGTYFNTGFVGGAGFDSDPSNDSSAVQTTVVPVTNLSVVKTASVTTATLLVPFTYTITATNTGGSDATSVTVSDILPPTIAVGTVTASQGTVSVVGGVLSADLGTIASGGSATVTVDATPQTRDTLVNTAVVATAGAVDSNPADDTSVLVTGVSVTWTPVLTDDFDTTGGVLGETGWSSLAMNTPGFAAPEYDQAAGAYKARIAASPDKFRVTGVRSLGANSMLYSNVGTDKYVRVKYYLYTGDQSGNSGSPLNEIPALRVRASNRFAVTSLLEVFSQTERDPFTAALANELRPSSDPAKPSIYRVDFDPIDTPYLVANPTTERIMRAFEAYSTDPSDNGYIAMTEAVIGTYPAVALPDSAAPVKVYTTADLADPQTIVTSQTLDFAGAVEGGFGVPADPAVVGAPTYTADAVNGVTLDTTAVTTGALAVLSNEFYAGASAAARVRVEEGKIYKVRFHLTSTVPTSSNSSINLRVRTIKFSQTQRLVIGGAYAAGAVNNLMAQEALPGVGSLNPDQRTPGENGGWYNVLVNSIMDRDIRPELAPGAPLSDAAGMPLISAEPGPGQNASSLRDIKIGMDIIDTISGAPLGYNEQGNVTCDTVEIRTYDQILD